jgi:hypothetical protein
MELEEKRKIISFNRAGLTFKNTFAIYLSVVFVFIKSRILHRPYM